MRLATWNVNSIDVRLPQVLAWLDAERPDALALQETKVPDERFPRDDLAALGYHVSFAGQKACNGVALLTREPAQDVLVGVPGVTDGQRRAITATVGGVRIACLYVPNGHAVGTEKYAHKLEWMAAAREWLGGEAREHDRLAVLGDINVAPDDRDVYDPAYWRGKILCSDPERAAFRSFLGTGLRDAFRLFDQPPGAYSFWSYRGVCFPRNMGLRIDHQLVSAPLARACRRCWIDRRPRAHERPSDHAPVVAEYGD